MSLENVCNRPTPIRSHSLSLDRSSVADSTLDSDQSHPSGRWGVQGRSIFGGRGTQRGPIGVVIRHRTLDPHSMLDDRQTLPGDPLSGRFRGGSTTRSMRRQEPVTVVRWLPEVGGQGLCAMATRAGRRGHTGRLAWPIIRSWAEGGVLDRHSVTAGQFRSQYKPEDIL